MSSIEGGFLRHQLLLPSSAGGFIAMTACGVSAFASWPIGAIGGVIDPLSAARPATTVQAVPCRIPIPEDAELRLLTEAHAKELHELIETNCAHLAAWLPWAAGQDYADTLGFIRETRAQLQANDGFQVAICVHERIAGVIGFTAVDWTERSTNIGYWLAAERQGRGTMSAAAALTDHALSVWELRRVTIKVATENARSRAIPERLGYREEATLPKAQQVGGRDLDLVVYSIAAEDWAAPDA
jgi:ribosomal-protein-serine acetyltransferase